MTVLDKVRAFVADHPGCTVSQIASAVCASDSAVRGVLAGAEFQASPRGAFPDDLAQLWRVCSCGGRSMCVTCLIVEFDGDALAMRMLAPALEATTRALAGPVSS